MTKLQKITFWSNLTVQINYKVTSWLSRNLYTGFDSDIIRTHDILWSCCLVTSQIIDGVNIGR